MADPEYARRATEASGKVGHSAHVLARRLGALRRSYRSLQSAHRITHNALVIANRTARTALDDAENLRELCREERRHLQSRLDRYSEANEELRARLARGWWKSTIWFLVGVAFAIVLTYAGAPS